MKLLAKAMSFKQATYPEIVSALQEHDDYIVCGHTNPDGDCLGSVLGMSALLQSLGKTVQPIAEFSEPLDDSFKHLPGIQSLLEVQDAHAAATFITVDACSDERLGNAAAALRAQAQFTMVLDHHEITSCSADIVRIQPNAPSATCLVWETAKEAQQTSEDIAACCYAGLMTDTGRFQYQNTSAYAFQVASEMAATGINVASISTDFFQNKTVAALKLEALAIDRMELLDNGTVAITWVDIEDMARLQARKSDTEGIVNALRSIGQVRIACVLKDRGSEIRGSFRSKDGTNVAALAEQFGGGGHKAAAGFTLHCSMEEALYLVKQALADVFCN